MLCEPEIEVTVWLRPARVQRKRDPMARIVQKFGGTSVADTDRIRAVAEKVKREINAGNEVAVLHPLHN